MVQKEGKPCPHTESRLAAVLSFFRLKMDSATIVDVSDLLSIFLVSSMTIVDLTTRASLTTQTSRQYPKAHLPP